MRELSEKLASDECYLGFTNDKPLLVQVMVYFAIRQQAIVWANGDPD